MEWTGKVVEALRQRIDSSGTVRNGLVIVDTFLNHRTDPELLWNAGQWLRERLGRFDLVVTAEASGIAPALAVAAHAGTDLVYAKKQHRRLDSGKFLAREVRSPTKNNTCWLTIRRELLPVNKTIVVVDDFLCRGDTASMVGEMIEESGNQLGGFGFVIEKTFTGGRGVLEGRGWEVVSAATVSSIENDRIMLSPPMNTAEARSERR